MFIRPTPAYLVDPFAATTSVDLFYTSQTYFYNLMQRQLPSKDEWTQVEQLFERVTHLSTKTSTQPEDGRNPDVGDSDREADDLEALLDKTLHATEKIDPQTAQRISEMSQCSSVNPPQAGPSGSADSGASSAQGHPQGHLSVAQRGPMASQVNRCTGCGTSTTPEWRRGPHGPRSLCNGCGLVWQKIKKKREQGDADDDEDIDPDEGEAEEEEEEDDDDDDDDNS